MAYPDDAAWLAPARGQNKWFRFNRTRRAKKAEPARMGPTGPNPLIVFTPDALRRKHPWVPFRGWAIRQQRDNYVFLDGITSSVFPSFQAPRFKPIHRRKRWGFPRRVRTVYLRVPVLTADMATLVVQHVSAGLIPSYVSAQMIGDRFLNEAGAIINVINAGGSTVTVTITAQVACNQNVLHNKTLVLGSGQQGEIGTFDYHYNDTTGFVNISYSSNTGVTVAVTAP
jgi:hypothetical protein